MTHDEAYNAIVKALPYLSPKLADKDGVLKLSARITFYRDPNTDELTNCTRSQEMEIF
jgi:hypothetical protein